MGASASTDRPGGRASLSPSNRPPAPKLAPSSRATTNHNDRPSRED